MHESGKIAIVLSLMLSVIFIMVIGFIHISLQDQIDELKKDIHNQRHTIPSSDTIDMNFQQQRMISC